MSKIIVGLIVIQVVAILATYIFVKIIKKRADAKKRARLTSTDEGSTTSEPTPTEELKVQLPTFDEKLKLKLKEGNKGIFTKIGNLFSRSALSPSDYEEIEELLYSTDMGSDLISELMTELKKAPLKESESFKTYLAEFLLLKLEKISDQSTSSLFNPRKQDQPKVIMVVGVNGAGKTTTIGKLATKLKQSGMNVVVGACDTFRAAAVDQLQVWCDRAEVKMVRLKEGAQPSGAAFAAIEEAKNGGADYCIIDTAGRLHTKENLMEELVKMKRVLGKLDPSAPHEVLLVIDAVTGQNAIRQAEEFHKALGLTGLVFTKCDGSSKAGSGASIMHQLKIPIHFIGIGEDVSDLDRFYLRSYLSALLSE